jgi:hypothetical protein
MVQPALASPFAFPRLLEVLTIVVAFGGLRVSRFTGSVLLVSGLVVQSALIPISASAVLHEVIAAVVVSVGFARSRVLVRSLSVSNFVLTVPVSVLRRMA